MARKIAELLIKLGADVLGVEKMSSDVRKQLRGLQKDVMEFGKSWSMYVTAPLAAAAAVSVRNADVQVQAEKRLLVALKGREDVQKRLMAQASELQSRSLFGDEETIGQQAYLASLGLTEQQINDVIEASAQLSTATGMTLDSAVKNLAKTFGGLTGELGESIPALKNYTTEQLKNGEAVKFILANYKGFAEASSQIGMGPIKQLTMALGDLSEEFGKILLPAIQKIASAIKDFVAWLQQLPPVAKTTVASVAGIAAAVGPLSLAFGTLLKVLPALKVGFAALTGPVGLITTLVGAATTAIIGFNAAKKQAFSDEADKLVEKWRNGDYTIEQLEQLRTGKEARVSGLKTLIYYDQKDNSYDPSKPGRIRENKAQIEQLEIEIEAINRLIKIREEEAKYAVDATGQENENREETLGLLGELQQKISDLEAAKKKATSTYEIHNLNVEIKALNDELSRIQSLDTPIGYEPGRLFGGVSTLKFDPNAINPPESDWSKAKEKFYANMQNFGASAYEQIIDIGQVMTQAFQSLAVGIGTALGDIFSGDGSLESVLNLFTSTLGQFLVKLGTQLIATAEIVVKIKAALSSLGLSPWGVIAVGVAAIAAGTAMMNLFSGSNRGVALAKGGLAYGPTMALVGDNPGAGSDPEVIAPLSKLRQYGMGRQTIEFVGGRFALSGSDLVLAIRREDARIAYTNGL